MIFTIMVFRFCRMLTTLELLIDVWSDLTHQYLWLTVGAFHIMLRYLLLWRLDCIHSLLGSVTSSNICCPPDSCNWGYLYEEDERHFSNKNGISVGGHCNGGTGIENHEIITYCTFCQVQLLKQSETVFDRQFPTSRLCLHLLERIQQLDLSRKVYRSSWE